MTRRDFLKRASGAAAATVLAAGGSAAWFLNTPQFGRKPSKNRLERIISSPNWKDGAFRNFEPLSFRATPEAKRSSRFKTMWNFLLGDKSAFSPASPIPVKKTDLAKIPLDSPSAVWFGHSSCLLTLGSKRILIDPVFSSYASPLPFINRAFPLEYAYSPDDMPEVDLLVITHDHWDHLDYPTLRALYNKVKRIVAPLGVGEYLEQWGFDPAIITEGDWWEAVDVFPGRLKVTFLPARHFSGRLYRPNQTLWTAYLFEADGLKVFFSGDGGWGSHINEIASRIGHVDFAFLENGQYNPKWPTCHMAPWETARTGAVIGAKYVIPIHNCKFALSEHAWNAPMKDLYAASRDRNYTLLQPMIGEVVALDHPTISRSGWFDPA